MALRPQLREGGLWLGSRVTNGVLGLAQVSLTAAAIGPHEAGRFFLLWTGSWLLATVLKFGTDGILPRVVAEAHLAGRDVPSLRRPLAAGAAAFALLLVPLLAVFRVPIGGPSIAVTVGIALCWAATFILAGALKADGQVGLSGIVMNIVWPLGPTLAPLILLGGGGDWQDLAAITSGMAAVSLVAALAISRRALRGFSPWRLISARGPTMSLEADVVGAAVVSLLYELMLWLPVVSVALAGVGGTIAAAVFATVRVAAVVSWPYTALVATLTPRIAGSLARRNIRGTRRLLLRGSVFGVVVTLPLAAAIAVDAKAVLHLFDSAFGVASTALVLIVATRVLDAAAGPVGEALLVGRRTWLDSLLVSAGVIAGLVIGTSLEPHNPATAAGIAGAIAFALTNLLRIGVVWRLLSRGWSPRRRVSAPARGLAGAGMIAAGVLVAVGLEVAGPRTREGVWIGVAAALLVAARML